MCVCRLCALTLLRTRVAIVPAPAGLHICAIPREREKCVASHAYGRQMRAMHCKIFDDYSQSPKMEQALSKPIQPEPAVVRNSWRELLEIVDSYLTRHGMNG